MMTVSFVNTQSINPYFQPKTIYKPTWPMRSSDTNGKNIVNNIKVFLVLNVVRKDYVK